MAKLTVAEKKVRDRPSPDLVLVKALYRGQYAVVEVIDIKQPDGSKLRELGRNDIIRNEGEVFEMDTTDMKVASKSAPVGDCETVQTKRGTFLLPMWVTLAGKRDRELMPAGHTTTFRDENVKQEKGTNDDDDLT